MNSLQSLHQMAIDFLSSHEGRMKFYTWIVKNGLCNPVEITGLDWSGFKRRMDILTSELQEDLEEY